MPSYSGGGGGLPPGVSGDGLTPGGLSIAGLLTALRGLVAGIDGDFTVDNAGNVYAGDPDGAATASSIVSGALHVLDNPGTESGLGSSLLIEQTQPLTRDNSRLQIAYLYRQAALNGHDYQHPAFQIEDLTASLSAIFQITKNSVTQFQVDSDGIRVHGKFKTGASVAHVLGAYSGNAVPVYSEDGVTLLGYVPLYA